MKQIAQSRCERAKSLQALSKPGIPELEQCWEVSGRPLNIQDQRTAGVEISMIGFRGDYGSFRSTRTRLRAYQQNPYLQAQPDLPKHHRHGDLTQVGQLKLHFEP